MHKTRNKIIKIILFIALFIYIFFSTLKSDRFILLELIDSLISSSIFYIVISIYVILVCEIFYRFKFRHVFSLFTLGILGVLLASIDSKFNIDRTSWIANELTFYVTGIIGLVILIFDIRKVIKEIKIQNKLNKKLEESIN